MSYEIMVSGNLAKAPQVFESPGAKGLQFTVMTRVPHEGIDDPFSVLFFDVTVAGGLTRRASKLKKGDGVWVRGHVTLKTFVVGNEERTVHKLIANELITHNETHEA